jgi:hypothetical protein
MWKGQTIWYISNSIVIIVRLGLDGELFMRQSNTRIECDAGAASKSIKFGRFWLSLTRVEDATGQVVYATQVRHWFRRRAFHARN